jgi:hypothetical protein
MTSGVAVLTAAVAGVAAGAVGGYVVAKKRLETKYARLLEEELEATKNFYASVHKTSPGFSTAEEAAKTLGVEVEEGIHVIAAASALSGYQGNDPIEVDETKIVSIFSRRGRAGEIPPEEMSRRTEEAPYVISSAEFLQGDLEYDQSTITYYEGDGVLAAEDDSPIDDVDQMVGAANLQRFGDYSGDDNVVYIRNDATSMDYHILRSEGKYAEEVAGFTE